MANHLHFDPLLDNAQVVEDAKLADAQFPFGDPIGTQPLSISRYNMWLVRELLLNAIQDDPSICDPKQGQVIEC
jgi:hypothetical protein